MHFVDSKLIEHLPTPVRIEDFTELKQFLAQLRQQGVQDIVPLLKDDHQHTFLLTCLKKITLVAANQSTLDLYEARNLEELRSSLHQRFSEEMFASLRKCLSALWQDLPFHSDTMVNYTVSGKRLVISLHSVTMFDEQQGRELYFVSTIDLTHRFSLPQHTAIDLSLSEHIFHCSPIAMLLCDASAILKRFQYLRDIGIENIEQHLASQPEWVDESWQQFQLLQSNPACLELFKVNSLTELIDKYHFNHQISLHKNFCTLLQQLWKNFMQDSNHALQFAFLHNTRNTLMHAQCLPNSPQPWSKLLLCLTDINTQVEIDDFKDLLSQRHPISKLYNSRFLRQEITRLEQDSIQPVACIYIKLDTAQHDTHPSQSFISASLLSRLSDILHYLIQRPFCAAHIEQHEIVVLLPGCQQPEVQRIMAQIHTLVQVDEEFYHSYPLHIAMGSACSYPQESLDQMIVRADQNLHNSAQQASGL